MALILGTKIAEHDATFALVKDGKVLRVYEEERFNQIKHGQSCSATGLNQIIEDSGYRIEDIDHFTNCVDPKLSSKRVDQVEQYLQHNKKVLPETYAEGIHSTFDTFHNLIEVHTGQPEKIQDVRHHLAHIAGVYFPSNSSDAAIISIDGGGEAETIVIAQGKNNQITILKNNTHPHSLGHLYLAVTNWLGWGYGEEGKTMALASYGEPKFLEKLCDEFIEINDSGFINYKTGEFASQAVDRIFGQKREHSDEITQYHKNVAASVQHLTNEVLLRLAKTAKKLTQAKTLIITGGVALNSVSNGVVMAKSIFEEVQVFPHANDTGTAIGGALWLEYSKYGRQKGPDTEMPHAYYGKEIDLHNIERDAKKYSLTFKTVKTPSIWAAQQIAKGKIVGWIQGRSEIGPRALGNRSILANPQIAQMKITINDKIKNRELWRPFAPSVLAEDTSLYFETIQALPYMVIVASVKEEWRSKLPAITHIDGSARVQSVVKNINPLYHKLLEEVKALTGVGMVINTSFNDRGEPVINTVDQAIRLFLRSEMDALVIGDTVFENKEGANINLPPFSPFLCSLNTLSFDTHYHLTSIAESLPTQAFCKFFYFAVNSLKNLTIDPEIITLEELKKYIPNEVPNNWTLKNTPPPNATILVLGPRGGYQWAFDKTFFDSKSLCKTIEIANKDERKILGIDSVGGITNLEIITKLKRIKH
jgi:carbamoyltransferase